MNQPKKDIIEDIFDSVLQRLEKGDSQSSIDFIKSLRIQYRQKRQLSPKQHAALMKFYENDGRR